MKGKTQGWPAAGPLAAVQVPDEAGVVWGGGEEPPGAYTFLCLSYTLFLLINSTTVGWGVRVLALP